MRLKLIADLKRIADHYGKESQLVQLQEECGELWGAIHEYVKEGEQEPDYYHTAEEIADVLIMIYQVMYLLDLEDDVDAQIADKINRQLKRMEDEKSE